MITNKTEKRKDQKEEISMRRERRCNEDESDGRRQLRGGKFAD